MLRARFSEKQIQTDSFVIYSLLFMLLFVRFFLVPGDAGLFNSGYLVMAFLTTGYAFFRIYQSRTKVQIRGFQGIKFVLLVFIIWGLMCFLIFLTLGFSPMGFKNFRRVLDAFWLFPMFLLIVGVYSKNDLNIFQSRFTKILNIYFWINSGIILLENALPGFLVGRFLEANSFPQDQMTGLIGFNGTAIMGLFWQSLLFLNLIGWNKSKSFVQRLNVILEISLMFFISQYVSEMKNFILTLVLIVVIYTFFRLQNQIKFKSLLILVIGFFSFAAIGTLIYNFNSQFRSVVQQLILVFSQFLAGSDTGSDIRIHTFWVATHQAKAIGFSHIDFSTQTLAPQLDVTSWNVLLIFGGWSFALLTVLFFSACLACIAVQKTQISFLKATVAFFVLVSYFAIVTVLFQDSALNFFIYALALAFNLLARHGKTDRADEYTPGQSYR